MRRATRDLILGVPRPTGQPVPAPHGHQVAWIFALRPANSPPEYQALAIKQSPDPRRYLRDLHKKQTSGPLATAIRKWEALGIPVHVHLLHEIIILRGERDSPELHRYQKMDAHLKPLSNPPNTNGDIPTPPQKRQTPPGKRPKTSVSPLPQHIRKRQIPRATSENISQSPVPHKDLYSLQTMASPNPHRLPSVRKG